VTQVSDRFGHVVGVHFGQTNYRDGYSAILRADSSRALTVSVDLAATLLSRVYGVILNPATPDRPTITWSSAGSLASSDGMLIAVAWTDADYVRHNWLVLAPPFTTSSFRLPQLPDDLAIWQPNVDATYVDIPWIEFVEADYIDGYGEFRAGGHDFTEVRPRDVPTGGTLRISSAGGTML